MKANAAAYNADVAISTPITADSARGPLFWIYDDGFGAGRNQQRNRPDQFSRRGDIFPGEPIDGRRVNAGMKQVETNCARR